MTPEADDLQTMASAARPLRVLFATRWYPAFDSPSRGSFVADQANALAAAGVQVTVASWEIAIRRGTYAAIDGPHAGALAPDARGGRGIEPVTPGSWGGGRPRPPTPGDHGPPGRRPRGPAGRRSTGG